MYKTCNFWLSGGAIAPIAPPLNPPLATYAINPMVLLRLNLLSRVEGGSVLTLTPQRKTS